MLKLNSRDKSGWCLAAVVIGVLVSVISRNEAAFMFPNQLQQMKSTLKAKLQAQLLGSENISESEVDPDVPLAEPDLSQDDAEIILDGLGFNATADDSEEISLRFFDGGNSRILRYQKQYGLPETGELDRETKISLNSPKCGVSNVAAHGQLFKWRSSSLTYYVGDIPAGVNPSLVKQIMRDAFDRWSGATNLDFIETSNPTADIEILFGGRYHRKRGSSCINPFANNNILGHAFYPEDGSIHFNTQSFSGPVTPIQLLTTAIHEIGHALGLEHSLSMASVMYPSRVALFSELPEVDKQKIQLLYGTRFQTRLNKHPNAPTLCELSKYDAVLREPHKSILMIAGKYCYTPSELGSSPILLSEKWPGAPDTLDAAVSFGSKVYMFKNDQVWVFTDTRLQAGYPRNIRESFPGIPGNLDAVAFDHGMYVYAFKNDHYWRYHIHKKAVDLTDELEQLGVPGKIDAAHVQGDNIFLFKDTAVYVYNFASGWSSGFDDPLLNC